MTDTCTTCGAIERTPSGAKVCSNTEWHEEPEEYTPPPPWENPEYYENPPDGE